MFRLVLSTTMLTGVTASCASRRGALSCVVTIAVLGLALMASPLQASDQRPAQTDVSSGETSRVGVEANTATLAPEAKPDTSVDATPSASSTETRAVLRPTIIRSPDMRGPARGAGRKLVTIIMTGDTGYAPSRARVHPRKVTKHGRTLTFSATTAKIAHLIDGDINFANLETIVTDTNSHSPVGKAFNFRTHPNGVRALMDVGFNAFSLANNHAMDYGRAGATATLKHMAALEGDDLLGYAGVGATIDAAAAPSVFSVRGETFALSSMGIGGSGFRPKPGSKFPAAQLNIHSEDDRKRVLAALADVHADFRMLSLHYGQELNNYPGSAQQKQWRGFVTGERAADLIIGHHAHVAQGIERVNDRLIFYGLGNFLHPGTRNMHGLGVCRDWGILAKVHLLIGGGQAPTPAAVEVIPLKDTHLQPRTLSKSQARDRVAALNGLNRALKSKTDGDGGLAFSIRKDGSGLWCTEGSETLPHGLAEFCAVTRKPVKTAATDAGEATSQADTVVDYTQRGFDAVSTRSCAGGTPSRSARSARNSRRATRRSSRRQRAKRQRRSSRSAFGRGN